MNTNRNAMTTASMYSPRKSWSTIAASSRHGTGATNLLRIRRTGWTAGSGVVFGPNVPRRRRASVLVRPADAAASGVAAVSRVAPVSDRLFTAAIVRIWQAITTGRSSFRGASAAREPGIHSHSRELDRESSESWIPGSRKSAPRNDQHVSSRTAVCQPAGHTGRLTSRRCFPPIPFCFSRRRLRRAA